MTALFDLKDHGITVAEIHRNLPPSALYEHAIRYEKDASIAENGALVAYSGVKTGRSPSLSSFRLRKISLVGGAERGNFRATSLHLNPGRRLGE